MQLWIIILFVLAMIMVSVALIITLVYEVRSKLSEPTALSSFTLGATASPYPVTQTLPAPSFTFSKFLDLDANVQGRYVSYSEEYKLGALLTTMSSSTVYQVRVIQGVTVTNHDTDPILHAKNVWDFQMITYLFPPRLLLTFDDGDHTYITCFYMTDSYIWRNYYTLEKNEIYTSFVSHAAITYAQNRLLILSLSRSSILEHHDITTISNPYFLYNSENASNPFTVIAGCLEDRLLVVQKNDSNQDLVTEWNWLGGQFIESSESTAIGSLDVVQSLVLSSDGELAVVLLLQSSQTYYISVLKRQNESWVRNQDVTSSDIAMIFSASPSLDLIAISNGDSQVTKIYRIDEDSKMFIKGGNDPDILDSYQNTSFALSVALDRRKSILLIPTSTYNRVNVYLWEIV